MHNKIFLKQPNKLSLVIQLTIIIIGKNMLNGNSTTNLLNREHVQAENNT